MGFDDAAVDPGALTEIIRIDDEILFAVHPLDRHIMRRSGAIDRTKEFLSRRAFALIPAPASHHGPALVKSYATPALRPGKRVVRRSLAPKHLLATIVGHHDNVHLQLHALREARKIEEMGRKTRLTGDARRLRSKVPHCRVMERFGFAIR